MRRLELPTSLANGSFSVLAADAAAIPRKRTRAQDLITVSRGIRIPAGSSARGAAALRAYCQLDEGTVLCHHTAARLWHVGLPLWADCDWRTHLARPRGGSIPKRANVVGHRLDLRPGDVVMLDGVRVTSPERTFLDLAPTLPLDDLVALGLVRVGADSPPETHLRLAVVRGGLPEPELNHVVWARPARRNCGQPGRRAPRRRRAGATRPPFPGMDAEVRLRAHAESNHGRELSPRRISAR